jgi:HK97 family phage major capsid protein
MNKDIKDEMDKVSENITNLVGKMKPEVEELRRISDANQNSLDSLLSKNCQVNFGSEAVGIEGQIRKGLQDNTDNLVKFSRKEIKAFGFELKVVGDMSLGGNYTGGTASTNSQGIGIIGAARPRHVRDLFRQSTMTGSSLPVLKDNGGEGAPAPVVEGGLKPQFDFDLSEVSAKAETIAGVVILSRQFLDDIPSAREWLTGKMIEAYMSVEDDQLLNGDGISPNLKGINTAGNFTAATSLAAANNVVQLVSGIIQLRAINRTATGIVLHPTDLESILLNTAVGSGEFDLPSYVSVSSQGGISILGVPVVVTTAQTVGRYDIIDDSGMLMAFRQNTTIEFFEQDSTNVRYNKVTARIESRIAFPVYGSTYVIKGTF